MNRLQGTVASVVVAALVAAVVGCSNPKPDPDPKSSKNARLKVEAFKKVVAEFEKLPSLSEVERKVKNSTEDQWKQEQKKLEEQGERISEAIKQFNTIPFDPKHHKRETEEIVKLYDSKIANHKWMNLEGVHAGLDDDIDRLREAIK